MLKAIVFDYGKVLSLAPSSEDWERLASVFGVPVENFEKSYWGLRDKYDRAEFDGPRYWAAVGEQLGKAVQNGTAERLIALDNDQWTKENPEMLELAWEAQQRGLKIGILSNMQSDMLAAMRAKLRWLERFDAQIYTCEVGVIKPEPESYHRVLEALGERPENAIFFDDKPVNIEGARAVGMHASLFSGDVRTAYAAVEELGIALSGKFAS